MVVEAELNKGQDGDVNKDILTTGGRAFFRQLPDDSQLIFFFTYYGSETNPPPPCTILKNHNIQIITNSLISNVL